MKSLWGIYQRRKTWKHDEFWYAALEGYHDMAEAMNLRRTKNERNNLSRRKWVKIISNN